MFLALAFHAVNGLTALVMGAFPATLDELQHLSFIRTMGQNPRLFPDYAGMRVLDSHGAAFTATLSDSTALAETLHMAAVSSFLTLWFNSRRSNDPSGLGK